MDIGSLVVRALHRLNQFAILCVALVLCGSCDNGGDRLSELLPKFSQQRDDLNEARQLIQTLAVTEGILGLRVGTNFTEAPDRVWLHHNSPPDQIKAVSWKDPQSKAKLDRLRTVARKMSCEAVIIDERGQVRVIMYSGMNYDYGYEFFERGDTQAGKDGEYLEISGEERWVAFRR